MNEDTIEPRINGILAYGSIIYEPKAEITNANADKERFPTVTPFSVEFARISGRDRGFAPTLVPFKGGDSKRIKAEVFEMDKTQACGANILYSREKKKQNQKYTRTIVYYNANEDKSEFYISDLENIHVNGLNELEVNDLKGKRKLDKILFAQLGANISDPTPEYLSCLAIQSVVEADENCDGISYLVGIDINHGDGIVTHLSKDYEQWILQITKSRCLRQALDRARELSENIRELKESDLDRLLMIDLVKRNKKASVSPHLINVTSAKEKLKQIFENY